VGVSPKSRILDLLSIVIASMQIVSNRSDEECNDQLHTPTRTCCITVIKQYTLIVELFLTYHKSGERNQSKYGQKQNIINLKGQYS